MVTRSVKNFVAVAILAAAQASVAEDEGPKLDLSGFVDVYYAWNENRPADHENFFPGVGTTAKSDNELALNLAQLDLTLAPAPIGFRLSLGFGDAVDVVHAAEEEGWRHVVQASVQYQTEAGRGLLVEAGIYPSHVGFEAFQTKDNWNYTRSWLGELSPYYQTGIKLAYPFGERWSGQLHLLNGWQVIDDTNRGKTAGWQIAYASDKLSFSFNGLVGPEQPDNDSDLRTFFDTVMVWHATTALSLGASVDVASEERSAADDASWNGAALYARYAPRDWPWAIALRTERFEDEDGAISGTAQTLKEVTLTFEHRPHERLILKLEGRFDRSSAAVFAGETLDTGGSPVTEREQFLVLASAVARF